MGFQHCWRPSAACLPVASSQRSPWSAWSTTQTSPACQSRRTSTQPVVDYGSNWLTLELPLRRRGYGLGLVRVLAVDPPPVAAPPATHRGERLLRVLPRERVAGHLARARRQLLPQRSSSRSSSPSAVGEARPGRPPAARSTPSTIDSRVPPADRGRRPSGVRVHAGLADDQPPALLERGQRQQPGPLVDLVLARPRRRGPRRRRCRRRRASAAYSCSSALPPAAARRRAAAGPGNSSRSATDRVDGVLDLLVRDQPADDGDHRGRATCRASTGTTGSVPLCTTAIRGPRDAERRAARRGWPARPRRTGGAGRAAAPAGARSTSRPARSGRGRRPATARGARGGRARRPACG